MRVRAGNQAQMLALLRGLALTLIRRTSRGHLSAAIDCFRNAPATLTNCFSALKFLWERRDLNIGHPFWVAILFNPIKIISV